jgi:hypothetical protein
LAEGAYYLRHLERTQRPYTLTNQAQTQAAMAPMKALIETETAWMKHNDPAKIPVLTAASGTGIRVLIENLEEHLHRILGASGAPLAYIVRRLGEPPAEEDEDWHDDLDPICGEMVARAPHEGTDFIEDNRHVWHIIRDATYSSPAWSWISGFEKQMSGRMAFSEILKHYLGEHHQSVIKMAAEKTLADSYFAGERRTFTFEMFAALHKQAHRDMEQYGEPLSEDAKVRKFLHGIRAPYLNTAKEVVFSNPALRLNFDDAVCFNQRSANDNATSHRAEAQVSVVASVKPKNKRGDKKKAARPTYAPRPASRGAPPGSGLGGVIVDKIYSQEDWAEMTLDERSQVRTIRARSRAQGGGTRNISAVTNTENSSARNVRARGEENPARQVAVVTTGTQMSQRVHGI